MRPPLGYRLAVRAARLLLPSAGRLWPKLALCLAGRRASEAGFHERGRSRAAGAPPVVVLHAASAGELRQLEPVYRRVRERRPAWELVVTYFSPSAVPVAESFGADLHGFLPWDTPGEVARFLDAVRPAAIVTTRLDLWPELTLQAHRRGVRQALIAATVRPSSGRLLGPARIALAPAYRALDRVGAVDEEDIGRLVRLGVRRERIEIRGDPRYDAVVEGIADPGTPPPEGARLVAGSTWPADEAHLLAAFARVRERVPAATLLLVPHEPSPRALARIAARAASLHLPAPARLGGGNERHPLLVEDRVGRLARLYGTGVVAYVGGGFGRAGLHSVLEPAAWGRPVLVGPRWRESRDAARLFAAGGLRPLERANAVDGLVDAWRAWLDDPEARSRAGGAAHRVVRDGVGAADRYAELVEELVSRTD
jgi:3-deoxy-D-manno-octulosonic-acid transferase